MTLRDVFQAVSTQPGLLVFLLLLVPALAFAVNLWADQTAEEIWRWRYVYAGLVYLACLPGVFAVTLNVYLFLFERQSIWNVNLVTQVLPILSMVSTLVLIRRKIPFDRVPGFGWLSGFMTLIAAVMGLLWVVDRTRIYAVTYIPFLYVVVGFIGLLIVIRLAWNRVFLGFLK